MPAALDQFVVSDAPPPTHYFQEKKEVKDKKQTTTKGPVKKVLRTFTNQKYITGHCEL